MYQLLANYITFLHFIWVVYYNSIRYLARGKALEVVNILIVIVYRDRERGACAERRKKKLL